MQIEILKENCYKMFVEGGAPTFSGDPQILLHDVFPYF